MTTSPATSELLDALEEAKRRAVARCLQIIRETRDGFLSPEYAVDQPLSSIMERFACDQCALAIEDEFALGTFEQRKLLGEQPARVTQEPRDGE